MQIIELDRVLKIIKLKIKIRKMTGCGIIRFRDIREGKESKRI